jgi:hypothetical protein
MFSSILKTLLVSLLFLSSAQAYEQLIITKTSNERNLNAINNQLKSINIKMYVQKKENYFLIYSQKFADKQSAKNALASVKRYFPYARVVASPKSSSDKQKKEKSSRNIFVSLGLGNASSSSTDGSTSGMSYMLEGGYYFTSNIFAKITYLNSATTDIDMQSFYGSLGYNYNFLEDFGLYGGVLFGYGTLALSGDIKTSDSSSFIYGGEIGLSYDVLEYLSLYAAAEYMAFEHIITDYTTFDSTLNMQVGVSYKF